jgi:ComEC/Rec2-like protein
MKGPTLYIPRLLLEHPLLLPALALVVGICLEDVFYAQLVGRSTTFLLLAFGFGVSTMFMLRKRALEMVALVALITAFCSLGAGLLGGQRDLSRIIWPTTPQTYEATVVSSPRSTEKTVRVNVEIKSGRFAGVVVATSLMKQSGQMIHPGDVIFFHSQVEIPRNNGNPGEFDYASWLKNQGIYGTTFVYQNKWKKTGKNSTNIRTGLLRYREELLERYKTFFQGDKLTVLAALTLGDRRGLNDEFRELFSTTGTSHILALSGLHLSILFGFLLWAIRPLRNRRKIYLPLLLIGVIQVWLFTFLVGAPFSLVRAAFMLTLLHLTQALRRDYDALNSLSLALLCILLVTPTALFDVGLQLSFLALLGILLIAPKLAPPLWVSKYWGLHFIYDLLRTSFCAQILTLPLIAYYFNSFSLIGLFTGWLVIPFAYAILLLALLFFCLPFAQAILVYLLNGTMDAMLNCLNFFSAWDYASITVIPGKVITLIIYGVIFFLLTYLQNRRARNLYGIAFLLLCGAISYIMCTPPAYDNTIIVYKSSSPTIYCIVDKQHSYLWSTRIGHAQQVLEPTLRRFLRTARMAQPQLIEAPQKKEGMILLPHVLAFKGKRIGLLSEKIRQGSNASLLQVNYLYIMPGFKQDLSNALSYFTPDSIILDSSLTDFYRAKYSAEAAENMIPYYDIKERGALILQCGK